MRKCKDRSECAFEIGATVRPIVALLGNNQGRTYEGRYVPFRPRLHRWIRDIAYRLTFLAIPF